MSTRSLCAVRLVVREAVRLVVQAHGLRSGVARYQGEIIWMIR